MQDEDPIDPRFEHLQRMYGLADATTDVRDDGTRQEPRTAQARALAARLAVSPTRGATSAPDPIDRLIRAFEQQRAVIMAQASEINGLDARLAIMRREVTRLGQLLTQMASDLQNKIDRREFR